MPYIKDLNLFEGVLRGLGLILGSIFTVVGGLYYLGWDILG
jgi:hypothetical protein